MDIPDTQASGSLATMRSIGEQLPSLVGLIVGPQLAGSAAKSRLHASEVSKGFEKATPAAISNDYHGLLASYYSTISSDIVEKLEKAIVLYLSRSFSASQAIFSTFSQELLQHPIIAYEHANAYWWQWELGKCAETVRTAFRWAKQNGVYQPEDVMYLPLEAMMAKTEVWTRGDPVMLRDVMRKARAYLRTKGYADYGPLEIACLEQYQMLVMNASNISRNCDVEAYTYVPTRLAEAAGKEQMISQGLRLTGLRLHVQCQGRLREALTLLDTELNFLSDQKLKVASCRSFLDATQKALGVLPSKWYLEGKAHQFLAQALAKTGDREAAVEEFHSATESYMRAPVDPEHKKAYMLADRALLKALPKEDLFARLNSWRDFLEDRAVFEDCSMRTSALDSITDITEEILKDNPSEETRQLYLESLANSERALEECGDVYFLHISITTSAKMIPFASLDWGSAISRQDKFNAKYPAFRLWEQKLVSLRYRLLICKILKDSWENTSKIVVTINDVVADRESFWGDEETRDTLAQPELDSNTPWILGKKDPSSEGRHWLSEWTKDFDVYHADYARSFRVTGGAIRLKTINEFYITLVRWMKEAFTDNHLNTEDLDIILLSEEERQGGISASAVLHESTNESIGVRLVGAPNIVVPSSRWTEILSALSPWLRDSSRCPYNQTKRHFLLARLQMERIYVLTGNSATNVLVEAQRMLDLTPTLDEEVENFFSGNVVAWLNLMAQARIQIFCTDPKLGPQLNDESSEPFLIVLALYERSLRNAREKGHLVNEALTTLFIAQLYYFPALHRRLEGFEKFFRYAHMADRCFKKRRDGWLALQGWEKVEKLLLAVEEQAWLSIYPKMLIVLSQLPREHSEMRDSMVWDICQEVKSLGLGWLMRADVEGGGTKRMADHGMVKLGQTKALYDQADSVTALPSVKVELSEPENTPLVQEGLSVTLPGSGPYSLWASMQDLYCKTLTTKDLDLLSTDAGGSIVYIDWYHASTVGANMQYPYMTLLAPPHPPKTFRLPILWEEVNRLIDKFIDPSFDVDELRRADAFQLLQQFSPLLDPLEKHTKVGQTLVLSSIGRLHRVPLHVIKVEGVPLIERNPVVYISSLSVLHTVYETRKASSRARELDGSSSISIYGDPTTRVGRTSLRDLSEKLAAPLQENGDFTAENFASSLRDPKTNLVHYHAHALFEAHDPQSQGLLFSDKMLNLRDIFDLSRSNLPHASATRKAASGCHATLLACGSGISITLPSNDVLGLVPAFLYAGASSTVSTLWPFDDEDASAFEEEFYRDFEVSKAGRVDLARALQRAVLAIRDVRPELYAWGGFVLNGWWILDWPGEASSGT